MEIWCECFFLISSAMGGVPRHVSFCAMIGFSQSLCEKEFKMGYRIPILYHWLQTSTIPRHVPPPSYKKFDFGVGIFFNFQYRSTMAKKVVKSVFGQASLCWLKPLLAWRTRMKGHQFHLIRPPFTRPFGTRGGSHTWAIPRCDPNVPKLKCWNFKVRVDQSEKSRLCTYI